MRLTSEVLRFVLCLVICLAFASGCKRRPQNYAGLPDPQRGEVIDPHRAN
jgi:hypothetical protein